MRWDRRSLYFHHNVGTSSTRQPSAAVERGSHSGYFPSLTYTVYQVVNTKHITTGKYIWLSVCMY